MKKSCFLASHILAFLLLPAFSEASLPLLQVPILDEAVCVDGALTEPAWKQAGIIEKLSGAREGRAISESTKVLLWADKENLHIGWICIDSEIHATMTERDSEFWLEEVVEIFLTPSGLNRYFELQWNPLGGTFDAIIKNKIGTQGISLGIKGDWSYTAEGMRWAVNNDPGKHMWTVEVAIPFKDLTEEPPQPGTVWQANFYRTNAFATGPQEFSCWSSVHYKLFHQPLQFGRLIFFRPEEH